MNAPRERTHRARHLDSLRAALGKDPGIVADLGCGDAILSPLGGRYVGLDRAGRPAIRADIQRVPLKTASCDSALCVNSLHHAADPTLVLEEIHRILRAGGRAYIKDAWYHGDRENFFVRVLYEAALLLHYLLRRTEFFYLPSLVKGQNSVCPHCIRRFFQRRGYALESPARKVLLFTKPTLPAGGGVSRA